MRHFIKNNAQKCECCNKSFDVSKMYLDFSDNWFCKNCKNGINKTK